MDFFENKETIEKAVLFGVHRDLPDKETDCTTETMEELCELAKTAGAQVVGRLLQNKPQLDAATYLGEGKLLELKELCLAEDADLLICDDELSGSQIRNIENETGVTVIDRSRLILDIFARHAKTREGKCQVELAQLNYLKSRLVGVGKSLSRLGGGIGTRGPGESKLESDRRHINTKISSLSRELKEIKAHRGNMRKKRMKSGIPTVALVGYTNAGKTSLLNALTQEQALAENKLFATLDPLVRHLTVSDTCEALLVDTVGFIRKLPHQLIEAFQATLEEAVYADLLIHLVDASSSESDVHIKVVSDLLHQIGAGDKPVILAYNKCDLVNISHTGGHSVAISARTGQGIDNLLRLIEQELPVQKRKLTFLFPYQKGELLPLLYQKGAVIKEEYREDGIFAEAVVDASLYQTVKQYVL